MFQFEGKLGTKLANGARPLMATKQLNKEHHCLHIERRKSYERTGVFEHENIRNKQSETKSPTSFTSVKASVSLQKKHKIAPKKWSVKMSLNFTIWELRCPLCRQHDRWRPSFSGRLTSPKWLKKHFLPLKLKPIFWLETQLTRFTRCQPFQKSLIPGGFNLFYFCFVQR